MPARSWIPSANNESTHFPLQNLPYGVFRRPGEKGRCCVAIGDQVLDLAALERARLFTLEAEDVFDQSALNTFMALGAEAWTMVRDQLTSLLAEDGHRALRDNAELRHSAFVPQCAVEVLMPFKVSGYTDFYAGRNHAVNVGSMFRGPENALSPNWLHMPIGYNGRASTVVVSGTPVRRPLGQMKPTGAEGPEFGPCRKLDIELEMGAVVGLPSTMGDPLTVAEAEALIFGYVILNDWSARDIQQWEYQPLGPFQSKAFASTISPWVVTKAALEPFRTTTPRREIELLPYLLEPGPMLYDIELAVELQPHGSLQPTTIARTNYRHMYYSAPQQLAHHAIGGCRIDTGDLLGSGTISGPDKGEFGSLLEIGWNRSEPIVLADGQERRFIEDGDTLTLTGLAQGDGHRVGFGTCVGTILPAPSEKDWTRSATNMPKKEG